MVSRSEDCALFQEKLKVEADAAVHQIPEREAAWEQERKKDKPDLDVKFSYAYVLSRSAVDRHRVLGLRLMNELIAAKVDVEECLYSAAVAYYQGGQLTEARNTLDRLLRTNPDHRYGNELHRYLKDAQAKQDLVTGVGVGLGVVAAVGAVILGAAASRRR